MKCLVTGATGAVGPTLVRDLVAHDCAVTVLASKPLLPALLPESIRVVTGSVLDRHAVERAAEGADVVFHLAARLHAPNPSPIMQAEYERVNVEGTRNVADGAIVGGARRMVLFSTIAVYGDSGGRVLTEADAPNPDSMYGRTKLAAERLVLERHNRWGEPLATVLRFGAIYGARMKGNYRRLVHALARRRFVGIGNGSNRRTLIYDRDAAEAAWLSASHPAAAGAVFNVSDGEFHTVGEIIAAICRVLERPIPALSIPTRPARAAAGLVEAAAALLGRRPPIGRWTVDKYVEDIAVDSRAIRGRLGYLPTHDLSTGWRETICLMRQSGDLP